VITPTIGWIAIFIVGRLAKRSLEREGERKGAQEYLKKHQEYLERQRNGEIDIDDED
jgi:hypothetical protein